MESALLRTRLARALEAHGDVELALLFGSRARGDAGPSSDIDVAVIGRSIDAIGLAIELTDAIGIPVDVVDLSGDPGRFLARSLMVLETDLPAHRAMQRAFIRRVAARGLSGGR
ncbi:MAG: nucleotidyltransferase domain-containing protein [Deltaproteobacteria bacterium]|nr:MAG: nucleotidyltransferase domain-containing protein [Deltaproteobacteria bacterium]